ncbi:MAG: hypothetical protein IJI20_04230 [Firmicutes bacterium]|nr:hypothetical protein [Bacillota bacterium]
MKKQRKWLLLLMCLVIGAAMAFMAGCGNTEEESTEPAVEEETVTEVVTFAEADVPEVVQKKVDEVKGLAEKYAEQLTPEFGDEYVALMESGEGRDYAGYADLCKQLADIAEESGATYVYTLSPAKDKAPSLDGDTSEKGSFLITVDPAEEPDDWGEDYGWEVQFTEAWNGAAAAARSAWADDEEGKVLCWSAFAPVKDGNGNVVCLLGIDYPADEILDYPEWNRDSDSWNGIEK